MFNRMKDYISDNEFRVTIFSDRVYVINYSEIISLEADRVSLLIPGGKLIINGNNLYLDKMLDKEVLISGKAINIEVKYNDK